MKKSVLKRLFGSASISAIYYILAVLFSLISVFTGLLIPIITGKIIDQVLPISEADTQGIGKKLILMLALLISASLFQWLASFCTNHIAIATVQKIRKEMYEKINAMPLSMMYRYAQGDLIGRINGDLELVSEGLIQGISQLISGVLTIVGTLILMIYLKAELTLVVILLTPLSLFTASFIAKRTYHLFQKQSKVRGELNSVMEEVISGQKLIRSFGTEAQTESIFEGVNQDFLETGTPAQFFAALTNPSTRFVNGIIYAITGIIGIFMVISGGLTVGMLSSFLQYTNQYMKPFNEISSVFTEIQASITACERVFEVLDLELPKESEQALNLTQKNISFQDVSFSYGTAPFMEHLNFIAEEGKSTALVGSTGCGKTTLIQLIMGFYDISNGKILVGDTDISTVSKKSLRQNIGLVLQEPFVFSGTIRENLCYGLDEVDETYMMDIAEKCYVDDFVSQFPQGYDTIISDDSQLLSQGQKQLLCIARVMMRNAPILILDEATSNIDTKTEQKIHKALDMLMKGKTSIIIAHRLSTIQKADCIYCMDKGSIIEFGTHEELLKKNGNYAKLYYSQFEV